jgi:hypothetical protein
MHKTFKEFLKKGSGYKKAKDSQARFLWRLASAYTFYKSVNEKETELRIKYYVKKNVIINFVTALEIFVKDSIVENERTWLKEEIEKLLKDDKITLLDAFEFSKSPHLKPVHWIVHKSSFQNIENIDRVFSILSGRSFIKSMNSFFNKRKKSNKNAIAWQDTLTQLFDQRNKIIHEDSISKISNQQIEE